MISLADIAWDLASPQTSFGVLWGSFVTHSFSPQTNPLRISAGRLGTRLNSRGKMKKKKKKCGETAKNSSEWSKPSSGLGRGKGQQSLATFAADVSLLTDLCCSGQMNYSIMLSQFGKKTPPTSIVFSNMDIFEQAIQIALHMTIHIFLCTKKRKKCLMCFEYWAVIDSTVIITVTFA